MRRHSTAIPAPLELDDRRRVRMQRIGTVSAVACAFLVSDEDWVALVLSYPCALRVIADRREVISRLRAPGGLDS